MAFKKGDRVAYDYEDSGWECGVVKKVDKKSITVKFDDGSTDDFSGSDLKDIISESEYEKTVKKEKSKSKKKDDDDDIDDIDLDTDINLDDDEEGDDEDEKPKKGKKSSDDADEEEEPSLKSKLDEMDRDELKEYIEEHELGIAVKKAMDDDEIREAILEAEGEASDDDEEEDDEPKSKKRTATDDDIVDDEDEDEDEKPKKKSSKDEDEDDEDEDEKPKSKSKKSSKDDDDDEDGEGSESWYALGDDEDEKYSPDVSGTYRFWLEAGNNAEVTFVTPKPFTFREHTYKANGRIVHDTCIAPTGSRCPMCENKSFASFSKAFYVIDHREYKTKAGEKVKDQLRLLVMKKKSYGIFREILMEHFDGGDKPTIAGLLVKIKRSNTQGSPNTGDIFTIKGRNKKALAAVEKTVEDLAEELKPKSRKELARRVNFMEESDFDGK